MFVFQIGRYALPHRFGCSHHMTLMVILGLAAALVCLFFALLILYWRKLPRQERAVISFCRQLHDAKWFDGLPDGKEAELREKWISQVKAIHERKDGLLVGLGFLNTAAKELAHFIPLLPPEKIKSTDFVIAREIEKYGVVSGEISARVKDAVLCMGIIQDPDAVKKSDEAEIFNFVRQSVALGVAELMVINQALLALPDKWWKRSDPNDPADLPAPLRMNIWRYSAAVENLCREKLGLPENLPKKRLDLEDSTFLNLFFAESAK